MLMKHSLNKTLFRPQENKTDKTIFPHRVYLLTNSIQKTVEQCVKVLKILNADLILFKYNRKRKNIFKHENAKIIKHQ